MNELDLSLARRLNEERMQQAAAEHLRRSILEGRPTSATGGLRRSVAAFVALHLGALIRRPAA